MEVALLNRLAVYARVYPEHKLNIVKPPPDTGGVVAMTGDGVRITDIMKRANRAGAVRVA